MTITMHNTRPITIPEIRIFLSSTTGVSFTSADREDSYQWIEGVLHQLQYLKQPRPEKGLIKRYLRKMTGYSRSQLTRLITTFRTTTHVRVTAYVRHRFPRIYQSADTALLAFVDLAHGQLSGPATKKILKREHTLFGKNNFVRLSQISVAHLYNVRGTFRYREQTKLFRKTRPIQVPIGERRKPQPQNRPGFIRVDSVHQGDSPSGVKGVYHINLVDEVLQWELVVCVEKISELFLVPALEAILEQFPFLLLNFHADNGSEYINAQVAAMLSRLLITLTKSRPRHSNDNGLVETKNGSIIRKHLGYGHIPQHQARPFNAWYRQWFNIYLNYHRPCAFGKEVILNEKTGKRKRIYPFTDYQTPYEKLKSLPNAIQYLKRGVTFAQLDQIAYAQSDTDFAQQMNEAKHKLFTTIHS